MGENAIQLPELDPERHTIPLSLIPDVVELQIDLPQVEVATQPESDMEVDIRQLAESILNSTPQGADRSTRLPDIDLGLSERTTNIFGITGLNTSNRDARPRTIYKALAEAGALPYEPITGPVKDVRVDMDKYLNGNVILPGNSPVEERTFVRKRLVSFGLLRIELVDRMREWNHPLYQALSELSTLNAERIRANEGKAVKQPVLTQGEYNDTADDLLKVIFAEPIRERYDFTIKYLKSVARANMQSS